jgi:hypothetical protein
MVNITNSKKNKKIKLDYYAGEWVAFVGEKIIVHNRNLKYLMKEVDAKGLRKKASIFLVPRKDDGPYILFSVL